MALSAGSVAMKMVTASWFRTRSYAILNEVKKERITVLITKRG